MLHIFNDFETRSEVTIKDVGLANYAEHPSTLPLMLAYGVRRKQKQWILDLEKYAGPHAMKPGCPDDFRELVNNSEVIFHAHNAAFEILIYEFICRRRWGWPTIPFDRWRCTMAKASAANQPKKLGVLGMRLGLDSNKTKDDRGKELIKLLSVPTKAQKTPKKRKRDRHGNDLFEEVPIKSGPKKGQLRKLYEYEPNLIAESLLAERGVRLFSGSDPKAFYFFRDDPKLMKEFAAYNRQDIVAEMSADAVLPDLSADEQKLWELDRKINMRGIPVDLDLCHGAMAIYAEEVTHAHARIAVLTATPECPEGTITKVTQVQRIITWLQERFDCRTHGFWDYEKNKPSTADPIIPNFLDASRKPETWDIFNAGFDPAREMPVVRELLELRMLAGGTAVAKYKAAVNQTQTDHRVRDQILYHGAATGRWTAKGIQPHNMKRAKTLDEVFLDGIKTGDHATAEVMGDLNMKFNGITNQWELAPLAVMDVLKQSVRGLIRAPKGRKLVVSDFAGIEARVLHWLVGGEDMLKLFRGGQDTYIHAALDIYGCKPDAIAKWDGKKWKIRPEHSRKRDIGKAAQLGLGYGMGAATFQSNAWKQAGMELTEEFSQQVIDTWRATNPLVVKFWYDLEKACKLVVANKAPGRRKKVKLCGGRLTIYYHPSDYLCIRLPSGRSLYYFRPRIDKEAGYKLFYMDGSKLGKIVNQYAIDTYGGKLCENVIQAIARDLLKLALFTIDDAGLDLIFHVHDESVVETDISDTTAFAIVHNAMSDVPPWAAGLPLAAETYESEVYTK
jgi:DNA polymerase